MAISTRSQEACERLNRTNPEFRAGTVAQLTEKIMYLNQFRAANSISKPVWNDNFVNLGQQIGGLPRTPEVNALISFYNSSYGFSRL